MRGCHMFRSTKAAVAALGPRKSHLVVATTTAKEKKGRKTSKKHFKLLDASYSLSSETPSTARLTVSFSFFGLTGVYWQKKHTHKVERK